MQTWLLHYLLLFMNSTCGVDKFTKSWLCTCKSSKIFSILLARRLAHSSHSFELFKFHDFPWLFSCPFQVFHNLRFSCHFRKLSKSTFLVLGYFLTLNSSTDTNSGVQQNARRLCCLIAPLYIIVSYIVLALSSAVTDLSNKTLICHDFWWPKT